MNVAYPDFPRKHKNGIFKDGQANPDPILNDKQA